MILIRPLHWPEDREELAHFDTSFTTDRIYRVHRTEFSFALCEERINPPLYKAYLITDVLQELPTMDRVLVAERAQKIVGFAAIKYESWNRQAILSHFYVAAQHQRQRIGTALLDVAFEFSRSKAARCLRVETQHINYGAIQFYLRSGFRLCGLDEALYDPRSLMEKEIALFFVRDFDNNTQS